MQSPSLASPKTLKLHARKQRAQSGQQTSNGPLNLSGIFGSSQLSNSIFQSSGGNWQSQAPGADAADVYERFDYLSKLKEENEALMSLLKEVQLNKEDLSKRMHELEMTRDAILSLRPSVTRDMIDTYLSDTCPLASKNRPGLNLTTTQSVQAREIYDRMLGVAAIYRANQAELQDFLMQHLVKASDHFINDETADCMAAIDRLESIVRAGPRNIASAQDLARNFEESIFLASADRFAELLRDEVSKRNPAPVDRGFNESKIDAAVVEHQQAEIAQLTAQNDNLRNTVTELREKIAKLKVAGQQPGKGAKSRVTGGSSGKNASPATTNDKSATAATGAAFDVDDFDVDPTSNGVEGAAAGSGEGAGLHALQEEAATVAERAPWLVTLLHEKIHHYAQQIVDRHPLASPLTPEATRLVTQQVAHEVTHGTGLVLFLGLLKGALQQSAHRVYHTRIEQLLSGDLSEEQAYATETTAPGGDDDLFAMDAPPASAANDAKPLSQLLLDFVSQLLRLTALHNDVACFATLFLTYLRQRLQITAPVAASSPAASTPPAASSSSGTPLNLRPAVPVKSPTLAGVATAALAIPSLRRSANKKAAAQPQQATTSSQQQYTNPDNFFSSTNNTGSAPSPAYGVDDFMTGGGGGAGEPYLYRTRSGDSGDDTGGFPRRKSSPRDNLPRYMLPKNLQVTPGGAVRSRGGGGDGALADNASRASGSRR